MSSAAEGIAVSIRANPFKECDLSHLPLEDDVPWNPYASYLSSRPSFTLDPLFHAGAYYVQDSSAMFTGWMFRRVLDYVVAGKQDGHTAGLRVLDLCASPGGKSTDMATSLRLKTGGNFMLVSNEAIRARASVLQDNMAIWGEPNVALCSSDSSAFGKLGPVFDIIVADVPCSGEGMFRKSENARQMWSEDNVALCAARQRRIVADVWPCLREGGVLIYSTCTFNDSENDGNVKWIADNLGAAVINFGMPFTGPQRTECGFLLTPDNVRGEGQYCAALVKGASGQMTIASCEDHKFDGGANGDECGFFDRNGAIYALPEYLAQSMSLLSGKINVLSAGVHCFDKKGKDSIPCADLALSMLLPEEDFPSVELDRAQALRFLHRDSLGPSELPDSLPKGYAVVTYCGLPLGFIKNLGNRVNNLHPMSRRILMDISKVCSKQ